MVFCRRGGGAAPYDFLQHRGIPKIPVGKANISALDVAPLVWVFVISWCILFCGLSHHNHKRNLIPEALRLGEFNKLPKNKKASNKEKKKTLTVCIL